MAKKLGVGPVKRYGTRYGRTLRFKSAVIEVVQRARQKCPFCLNLSAKRCSMGVYECSTCSSRFTDDAYAVGQTRLLTAEEKNG